MLLNIDNTISSASFFNTYIFRPIKSTSKTQILCTKGLSHYYVESGPCQNSISWHCTNPIQHHHHKTPKRHRRNWPGQSTTLNYQWPSSATPTLNQTLTLPLQPIRPSTFHRARNRDEVTASRNLLLSLRCPPASTTCTPPARASASEMTQACTAVENG